MSTYDHVRCSQCGVPWSEHTDDCPRHDFRPGAVVASAVDVPTEHEARQEACEETAGLLRWSAVSLADSVARHELTPDERGGLENLHSLLIRAADLIERLAPATVCAACGEMSDGTVEAALDHVRTCERHPLRAEIEALRRERACADHATIAARLDCLALERERDALIAACIEESPLFFLNGQPSDRRTYRWHLGPHSGVEPTRAAAEAAIRRAAAKGGESTC